MLYDGDELIAEYNATGTRLRHYFGGDHGKRGLTAALPSLPPPGRLLLGRAVTGIGCDSSFIGWWGDYLYETKSLRRSSFDGGLILLRYVRLAEGYRGLRF
jgi:hypothetical protein